MRRREAAKEQYDKNKREKLIDEITGVKKLNGSEAEADEESELLIEVKKNTRAAGRKAKEAIEAAVTSDEAVATEIEVKKKTRAAARKAKETVDNLVQTATKKTTIYIQSQLNGIITPEEVLNRIPEGSDEVYIKPEENKAYWVKGEDSGNVTLW